MFLYIVQAHLNTPNAYRILILVICMSVVKFFSGFYFWQKRAAPITEGFNDEDEDFDDDDDSEGNLFYPCT